MKQCCAHKRRAIFCSYLLQLLAGEFVYWQAHKENEFCLDDDSDGEGSFFFCFGVNKEADFL
jgi:hypothetical protein